eukprot:10340212-Ditylum_brightwellii.AAC.1
MFDLTLPNIHQCNAAEQAICTYKNHLLTGLATCNLKFPVTKWDQFIPEAILTLNLLCTSRVNPKLLAHAYVFGNFNLNATPLAPPGTKVVVHKKPNHHNSWVYHGIEAAEVDANIVKLISHVIPVPSFADKEAIQQAIADITHILKT